MKDIKVLVSDEELERIAGEVARELGIPLTDAPDSFYGEPVFPELKEE